MLLLFIRIINGIAVQCGSAPLAIDPTSSTTLYAATDGGGIFKSTDSGSNWTAASSGLTNSYVQAVVINPSAAPIGGYPAGEEEKSGERQQSL